MNKDIIIHWFRQDLRLANNPSLSEASYGGKVFPIYILDEENAGEHHLGAASRWWLHHSLTALNKSVKGKLSVYKGDPEKILVKLARQHNIKAVYWNRCYEPWRIGRDTQIKKALEADGIATESFNGSLLWEPWENLKKDSTPYKVFTPFYKKGCSEFRPPKASFSKPAKINFYLDEANKITVNGLGLLPEKKWHKKLESHWRIGETNAQKRLHAFIDDGLTNYKRGRDFPALKKVSRLSPHLHFGEISPHQVWYAATTIENSDDQAHFLKELGWREFSYNLLYHFPDLPRKNLQPKFDNFPWQDNAEYLASWQRGQTGHPLVDAGMRELWQTGYMHNRIRMVVGSFLVKNLLLHWHHGEKWFWDCLLDADLASNSASWQWIAGCGADAAPYFRVFNPCTQGQKFDPDGEYTKRFVPELSKMPNKYLYNPWDAPGEVLQKAGVKLGENYPHPIVDLKLSRLLALDSYKQIKEPL